MAHAQISVEPFGGSDNEDFAQFEQLFQGYVGVAGIANAQQANFLQFHLRDSALRFYQTLPALTRGDVPLSLAALRDHFCNPQSQEVHVLKLEQSKFDIKRDSPENFLVNLTKKAQRAYPTPDLPAVAPLDAALVGAAADADAARFHGETAQRQERLDAENDHRNNQIKRLFIKGMPNWLRSKMMEQPAATTVQELCNLARKQMTIRDVCRNEDYPEDSFNEIGDTVSHNLISALSKLTTAQEQIEKQLNEVRSELSDQRKMIQSRPQGDNGKTQQSSQLNSQNTGGNNNQTQQQQNHGNNAQSQGTGQSPNQNNTSGPNQWNGYQGNGQQGYNQRILWIPKFLWILWILWIPKFAVPPTNVPVSPTDTWNSTEPTVPTKPELSSYTTECPILSEPDVPSTTPTATSDSHAATTEQPVCPTSLTTNDAAGAHAKS